MQRLFLWKEPVEVDCSFRYSVDDPYAISIELRLCCTLDRPDGRATFQADLHEVRGWLCSTYELVPAGSESELIDWHAWQARLLG
ncbi:SsgA family sporulation/cell division regulator [Streptomyces sp. VRA16 Mangrove soil]|uniref:SsgA family sporulation/cell division regulator n=1 Tax=Streptomyces sp. VRA16 Mangrove soil TaxID=2817434 RepID=UPI001A9D893D|nr:SsgA family sporulation/cell division regulator [Streptomyces sp. VRA16 Mangrove soil]MBO1331228.1 SsgA family sporulation/cell division regulator [Streptomyces sp. VRA16 Mangrove soil]